MREVVDAARRTRRQRVLVVVGASGTSRGIIDIPAMGDLESAGLEWAIAADVMGPFASVGPGATLTDVEGVLRRLGVAQVPVVADGVIVGAVGDAEVARAYIAALDASALRR